MGTNKNKTFREKNSVRTNNNGDCEKGACGTNGPFSPNPPLDDGYIYI